MSYTLIERHTKYLIRSKIRITLQRKISKQRHLTNIDYTMISEFPAGLQPEDTKGATLSGVEISKSGIGYMVSLQRELVETRQQLSDSTDSFIGHINTIRQGERYYSRCQASPQAGFRYLVATS